jgi:tetratricopeptide (TPR) repeat protein
MRRLLLACLVAGIAAGGHSTIARSTSVQTLLDDYHAGRFARAVDQLSQTADFDDILQQLRRDGPRWIDAEGAAGRAKRELTAATFALEAARAGEWQEWKWIQRQPRMEEYQPPNLLYWRAPPLLIEWGCELFRRDATPRPIERWWQLGALAVAYRSEDPQFLVGDTNRGEGVFGGEIGNEKSEIKHLDHVRPRFPEEMRFVLAEGIARDRDLPDDAATAYEALERDPAVGGEAVMRLGALLRRRNPAAAHDLLERVDTMTRDPYVVYLARFFRGQLLQQQGRVKDAEAAYRGAVAAVPHAQSATLALAALLAGDGRRAEAQRLVQQMLAVSPPPRDPWRGFVHADDRFWPQIVARLRAEILR